MRLGTLVYGSMEPPYPIYCAKAPHHITSVWKPFYTNDVYTTGSIGLGILVEPETTVCRYSARYPYLTPVSSIQLIRKLLERFWHEKKCRLNIENIYVSNPLPPGRGYGVSASTLVATSMLFSYECDVSFEEGFELAHAVEVEQRSGLGDVLAISKGYSVVFRDKPGSPKNGHVLSYRAPRGISILTIEGDVQHTNNLLAKYGADAEEFAVRLLSSFREKPGFEHFLEVSREFTEKAGLHSFDGFVDVVGKMEGVINVYAKKSVMAIFAYKDNVKKIADRLASSGYRVRLLEISYSPPTLFFYR